MGKPNGKVDTKLPFEYNLAQNHPNPFNPTTSIKFDLPMQTEVNLTIFNLMGQEVARLVDGSMDAGYHSVSWDATNVASGVYFYRLSAGEFSRTYKMLLLK